jgi:hypothetical protein
MTHKTTGFVVCAAVAVLSQSSTTRAQLPGTRLAIAMTHTGNFTVGVPGVYTIVVSNIGGASSSGQIDVFELFGSSVYTNPFTFVSAVGTGWSCSYEHLGLFTEELECLSSGVIAAGGSAAPIMLTVVPCCSGTQTSTVSVSGGGDPVGSSASDPTIVVAAVPTLPQWAMMALTVLLVLAGAAALRRRTTWSRGI